MICVNGRFHPDVAEKIISQTERVYDLQRCPALVERRDAQENAVIDVLRDRQTQESSR